MIQSFGDTETEKIFHQVRSKMPPPEIQGRRRTRSIDCRLSL